MRVKYSVNTTFFISWQHYFIDMKNTVIKVMHIYVSWKCYSACVLYNCHAIITREHIYASTIKVIASLASCKENACGSPDKEEGEGAGNRCRLGRYASRKGRHLSASDKPSETWERPYCQCCTYLAPHFTISPWFLHCKLFIAAALSFFFTVSPGVCVADLVEISLALEIIE